MKKVKLFVLLTMNLIILVSLSGCIDVNWAKDMLGDDPPPPSYSIVDKWTLTHFFEAGPHEDEMPIHIQDKTVWLKINITIVMEQSIGLVRNVEVVLSRPGDEPGKLIEHYARRYNNSAIDNIVINDPVPGEWRFHIEGTGFGLIDEIRDSYRVEVSTYEPDRRS
jgi:hypothetical protein